MEVTNKILAFAAATLFLMSLGYFKARHGRTFLFLLILSIILVVLSQQDLSFISELFSSAS